MSLQPQLIAPFVTGLETDLAPWLAPKDSFSTLENAHIKHGMVEKRNGYRFFGALIPNAATVGINAITQATNGQVTTAALHGYSTGDIVFITGVGGMTEVNNKTYTITVDSTSTFLLNVDTSSYTAYTAGGTVAITDTDVDRVMGIDRYIDDSGNKLLLAWNTTSTFLYNTTTDVYDLLDGGATMDGAVTDYIWTVNWQATGIDNRLYFTNGKAFSGGLNGIRYFDDATPTVTTSFTPTLSSSGAGTTRTLYGGKLLFTLRQRMLVLYTYEFDGATPTTHHQRMRWCADDNPNNWVDTQGGGGGFFDAPTGDQIVSARLLQDQIIVFFTNSVWSIVPISNPKLPFKWVRINSYRACDGKMASVSYDRYITALGVRGIAASDSNQTSRIDDKITDFCVNSINVEQFGKVFCLRDYQNKRWWTLFPNIESTENDGALIYDDDSKAYSTYDITLNCLGYGNAERDYTLADFNADNDLNLVISQFNKETLLSYYWQDKQDIFLGGDINGNIFMLDEDGDDNGDEIASTLETAAWNPYNAEGDEALLSYVDIYLDSHPTTTAVVEFFKDSSFSPYASQTIDFLPNLGFIASIQNISLANPVNVNAADHGLSTGDVIYIYGCQGMEAINGGPWTITVVDGNNFTINGLDSSAFDPYTGFGQVVRDPFYRDRIWKRAFGGGIGNEHRIRITSEGTDRPFTFHAFKPYFKKRGRRTID